MSLIDLEFMQRYQSKLDTAIKNYVKSKNPNEKGDSIVSGTDLDELTTFGAYFIADDSIASGLANLPLDLCGKVLVSDNGNGGIIQTYTPNHSIRLFQRIFWDNTWGEWVEYSKRGTIYNETLSSGSTSVTFTGLPTTGDFVFDIYTSKAGLDYSSIMTSSGSITLTYESQSSDVTVYLRVGEV